MALARGIAPVARARSLLAIAATITLVGIALSVWDLGGLWAWTAVVGLLLLALAIHRFGRTGPEEALNFESSREVKKD
ncbi:MAG TPA: hypothetical protein VGJ84_02705 [Polyangiaceae bacterium]